MSILQAIIGRFYHILWLFPFVLIISCGSEDEGASHVTASEVETASSNNEEESSEQMEDEEENNPNNISGFFAGLEYEDGIEPGEPGTCEAPSGNRCWYVDAAAADGGDGSFANPYNSFEVVVGYRASNTNYTTGLLQGGDYLYVKGSFQAGDHIADGGHSVRVVVGRGSQSGTKEAPTVIKSYLGAARAVFDGEFASWNDGSAGMIHISALGSDKIEYIVVENIEVKNSRGIGISFGSHVVGAEVANVVIYDSSVVPGNSSSGGIHFKLSGSVHEFILRNSHIYSNRKNENGVGYFNAANNNVGGVNILNEPSALDGSKITIYENIIEDEIYAVRHKHSGNIITEAYNNILSESINGFYIRAYRNNILHHNILKGMRTALYAEAENQNGDSNIEFYNNTIVDSDIAVHTGLDATGYARGIVFRDNIVSGNSSEVVLALGFYASNVYDLIGWSSSHNLYDRPNSSEFLKHEGTAYIFSDAMAVLNEANSNQGQPLFADIENNSFSLSENSPARGAGSEGQDLGAVAFE